MAEAIRAVRFSYSSEADLQEGISRALAAAGIDHEREVDLGVGRIDLLVGRVGVEVKVAGGPAEVGRQALRYLRSDRLDSLVLVTSRVKHLHLPDELAGKRVEVVTLAWAGL